MAKMDRRYEDAVMAMLRARAGLAEGAEPEMTETAIEALNLAGECDTLSRLIIEGSARMAEIYARYARDIRVGHIHVSTPDGHSNVRDIPVWAARLDQNFQALQRFVRCVYGKDAVTVMRQSLAAAARAAEVAS